LLSFMSEILHKPASQTSGDHQYALTRKLSNSTLEFYFSSRQETKASHVTELDLDSLPCGRISMLWIPITESALGIPVSVPVMVAKGTKAGVVLGLTACMHGNELSGMPCIHAIFHDLGKRVSEMHGTIVAVPVVNVLGYQMQQRGYIDQVDLNRIMPGKVNGTISQQYAYNFFHKIITKCNYLVDLHTASFGHLNSLYVRADMNNPVTAMMARLINPDIILHNAGQDGTLRAAACAAGIQTICVEMGDPQLHDSLYIRRSYIGIVKVMAELGDLPLDAAFLNANKAVLESLPTPVICARSYWIYTSDGGVLTVHPLIGEWIKKGDVIATIVDVFGIVTKIYRSPDDGIIIGKSANPTNHQGDRIIHLGIPYPAGASIKFAHLQLLEQEHEAH